MTDQQRFLNEDLVLKVSPTFDPTAFDSAKYEPFLDALCGSREYQKDAIRTTLRYLLGGRYLNLRALAEENFNTNGKLKERYSSFREFERSLQIPEALSCSLDLATGTGKSYVMYGIARILLAYGVVDRVLVLAPSTTIEAGLKAKFKEFSSDPVFKDLLPQDSAVRTPHVIDATESIVEGSICIENYHAVLGHVKSSIRDSLEGKGDRTLVLNDEVHHVYNASSRNDKRWKEFLLDSSFGFRYVVGFSGTCYIKDDYFSDVICRYSLREAMETGFVKSFEYVAEESSGSQNEKFQKMYDNHSENKTRYRNVKPLTILVSKDIASCKNLTEDLIAFLSTQEDIPPVEAAKKVLIVTSSSEHARNLDELPYVDRRNSAVEWIVSVSMLTEGWDVKNVFQIVPHEERAFNSKLLIAQVLGRGLRVPEEYKGERPVVTILNHDKWSKGIKHLVDEVLEIEKRIYSYPVIKNDDPNKDFNFAIHHVSYDRLIESEDIRTTKEPEFVKGYIALISQEKTLVRNTEYVRVDTQQRRTKQTLVRYKMYPVDEVAEHIHNRLKSIDIELGNTNLSEQYNFHWLKELINTSLRRINETEDVVSEDNRQRLYRAFGSIHLQGNKVPRFRFSPTYLYKVDTSVRPRNSTGFAAIRRGDVSIFWDEHSLELSDDETRSNLADLVKDTFLDRLSVRIENSFNFKTPLNFVIADHDPEYKFIRALTQSDNATVIDSWIKSTDHDFYSIEFGWRNNDHATRGNFNPDFFIKIGNRILVTEIKDDDQIVHPSKENKEKWKAARQHFQLINELQNEVSYSFNFLAPRDYDLFFTKLRQFSGTGLFGFESSLDVALSVED